MPELHFHYDESVDRGERIDNLSDAHMRHTVNKGRVAYQPNSLGGGCPFQAGGQLGGFVSHAEKIEAHKKANPDDVVYYTRLVKENPERAIETFLYRDQQKHENEMRLIQKQLPQAQAFYNAQTAEAKARRPWAVGSSKAPKGEATMGR